MFGNYTGSKRQRRIGTKLYGAIDCLKSKNHSFSAKQTEMRILLYLCASDPFSLQSKQLQPDYVSSYADTNVQGQDSLTVEDARRLLREFGFAHSDYQSRN